MNSMRMEGPPGLGDYLVVVVAVVILVVAAVLFLKYLLRPREKEADHIKRRILDDFSAAEESRPAPKEESGTKEAEPKS